MALKPKTKKSGKMVGRRSDSLLSPRPFAERLKPIRFIFNGAGPEAMAADPASNALLIGRSPYIISPLSPPTLPTVPANWNAIHLKNCRSMAEIQSALSGSLIGVSGLLLDLEKWVFTPAPEQQDPDGTEQQAATLVHNYGGLIFMTSPAANLATVIDPTSDPNDLSTTYLRLQLAAGAARYAEMFDIQSQRYEADLPVFKHFVYQATAQARLANPAVKVFSGISTQPIGMTVTVDDILAAISVVRGFVDGFWFNIPAPDATSPGATFLPEIAVEVLRQLGPQG